MNRQLAKLSNNLSATDGRDSLSLNQANQSRQIVTKTESTTGITWSTLSELMRRKPLEKSTDIEIQEALMRIYVWIGLRKQHHPTEFEARILMEFLRDTYPKMAKDELLAAFKLGIQGKLDVTDLNPYDQFSIPYLQKIIFSYRRFVSNLWRETPEELPKQIEYKMTNEEKLAEIEEYRHKNIRLPLMPSYLYDFMIQLDLINLTDAEKTEMYSQAIKIREGQLRDDGDRVEYKRFKAMKEEGFKNITFEETSAIEGIFKRLAIKKYYDTTDSN